MSFYKRCRDGKCRRVGCATCNGHFPPDGFSFQLGGEKEVDPFNCPKCGAHDFGLNRPKCPHCGYDETPVEVMEVQAYLGSPALILRRTEKALLWDYFEDWHGEAIIKFTTMPKTKLEELGDFDGF